MLFPPHRDRHVLTRVVATRMSRTKIHQVIGATSRPWNDMVSGGRSHPPAQVAARAVGLEAQPGESLGLAAPPGFHASPLAALRARVSAREASAIANAHKV